MVIENALENEKGLTCPFSTYIMPSPCLHVKWEENFIYDDDQNNYLLPGERHLKANPYWLPYYPWMWFVRRTIVEFGIVN